MEALEKKELVSLSLISFWRFFKQNLYKKSTTQRTLHVMGGCVEATEGVPVRIGLLRRRWTWTE